MEYKTLTPEQRSELHIADVDDRFLIFETEYDGQLEISKLSDGTCGFEVRQEETMFLNKDQMEFLINWLENSRW